VPSPHPWLTRSAHRYASVKAFRLGFFAALTVEAADVMIDLNGHTLAQAPAHALQQRAPFALIEGASAPFIFGQGPTNFGETLAAADGLVVENGVLGRSAHHGLHANGARRVLVRDVRCEGYEVAALSLHGAKDVLLERVHATGQFTHVPVLGTYSNARQLLPMAQRALVSTKVTAPKRAALAARVAHLAELMSHVLADVLALGHIDATAHAEAEALFANRARLPDGNSYGLVLHPLGAAVNAFRGDAPPEAGDAAAAERIYVRNSTFAAARARIIEVVALVSPAGTATRGPVGALLRIVDNERRVGLITAGDAAGAYHGNALADTQIALMDAALDLTNVTERRALFGTLHGPRELVRWAHGELSLRQLVEEHGYTYWRNGDTMLHVNKGAFGIRLDGGRDVCFDRVSVDGVRNDGRRGQTAPLPGEASAVAAAYTTALDGGHPLQGKSYGGAGPSPHPWLIRSGTATAALMRAASRLRPR